MYILLPKREANFREYMYLPFFYLIGPVLGGGGWQVPMCRLLFQFAGKCVIAVPCRWENDHVLATYFIQSPITYPRQLSWEQPHIRLALTRPKSCAVCWLQEESKTHPRDDGLPYGIDTFGEMNYFRGLLETNRDLQLVAGAMPTFPRFEQIIRPNWDFSYGEPYPFEHTMEGTAVRAAKRVCY